MNYKLVKTFTKAGSTLLLAFSFSILSVDGQEVKSLSGANSPQDDQNPVWIGSNTLLFSRAFHPENLGGESDPGDIWMTKRDESGEWTQAIHRPDLSTSGYDVPLGLEDVLTLLIYHQEKERQGVFQYSKFGSDWNFLRKIEIPGIETFEGELKGRVSQGGDLIFFSAKSDQGFGSDDLFVSQKSGAATWTLPQNLGPVINTVGQEVSPFFDAKKKELYFASTMHEGANGKDIFVAKALDETFQNWSKPKRWVQISSRGSEGSVTFISPEEIVWTSTQNSDGFADLLTFAVLVPLEIPSDFEIPSLAEASQTPISSSPSGTGMKPVPIFPQVSVGIPEVRFESENQMTKEESPNAEASYQLIAVDEKTKKALEEFTVSQKRMGQWQTLDPKNFLKENLVGEIRIESKGYFPKFLSTSLLMSQGPTLALMTKMEPGANILLDAVSFRRGTAELEGEDTLLFLEGMANLLNENDGFKVRISGHTDGAGDPGLNKALSLERAGAVRDFLVDKGVPFERLRIAGWGGTRPLASNATEAGRAKNRRVEMTVEQ